MPHRIHERAAIVRCLPVILAFASACVAAEPRLPPEFVGIWATERAVLRDGKWLESGLALYLDVDGVGAVIAGPPPVGSKVVASHDAAANTLQLQAYEGNKPKRKIDAAYDPSRGTITLTIGGRGGDVLTKRPAAFEPGMRKALGL